MNYKPSLSSRGYYFYDFSVKELARSFIQSPVMATGEEEVGTKRRSVEYSDVSLFEEEPPRKKFAAASGDFMRFSYGQGWLSRVSLKILDD